MHRLEFSDSVTPVVSGMLVSVSSANTMPETGDRLKTIANAISMAPNFLIVAFMIPLPIQYERSKPRVILIVFLSFFCLKQIIVLLG